MSRCQIDWKWFKRLAINRFLYGFVFITSGLTINLLQLVAYVCVRPFNKPLYIKINLGLAYSLQANLTFLIQWWSPSRFHLYVDSEDDFDRLGHEPFYCIMNHSYDIDWLFAGAYLQFLGLLAREKIVAKSSLKYAPILGWSWFFSDYIFLKREWDSDRQVLSREIKNILDYPPEHKTAVIILCEGTRFSKEKHAESMKVAREKGLPELKHHLLPRNKGFYFIATQLAGKFEYLYDMNMAIGGKPNGGKPHIADVLNGDALETHLYIRRIPMSRIPVRDERECADFLNKVYQEKDEIIDSYYQTGSFEALGVKKFTMNRSLLGLINTLAWIALIGTSTLVYLIHALLTYSWFAKLILVILIALIYWAVNWLAGQTDSKNTASKFGLAKQTSETKKRKD